MFLGVPETIIAKKLAEDWPSSLALLLLMMMIDDDDDVAAA